MAMLSLLAQGNAGQHFHRDRFAVELCGQSASFSAPRLQFVSRSSAQNAMHACSIVRVSAMARLAEAALRDSER
jgi:hypothetical protein